ncbi:hypothetical protein SAMN02745170_02945 [Propionispora hippei DSM 15287]|uniref:Uncharacterized protein n=1 Tax=Propionispora hippei DSM 15287 TaxID=1123003 RepID=A0A1M6KTC2_9FIRM|nr:hypothetical protein SAMN02745170_02945 [Propionispora hippei DSM 15287]
MNMPPLLLPSTKFSLHKNNYNKPIDSFSCQFGTAKTLAVFTADSSIHSQL